MLLVSCFFFREAGYTRGIWKSRVIQTNKRNCAFIEKAEPIRKLSRHAWERQKIKTKNERREEKVEQSTNVDEGKKLRSLIPLLCSQRITFWPKQKWIHSCGNEWVYFSPSQLGWMLCARFRSARRELDAGIFLFEWLSSFLFRFSGLWRSISTIFAVASLPASENKTFSLGWKQMRMLVAHFDPWVWITDDVMVTAEWNERKAGRA